MVFRGPMFFLAHVAFGNTVSSSAESQAFLRALGRNDSAGYVKMNDGQVCASPFMNVGTELQCKQAAQALELYYGGPWFGPWKLPRCYVEAIGIRSEVYFNLSFNLSLPIPKEGIFAYAGICTRGPHKARENELCAGVLYDDCESGSTCRQKNGNICAGIATMGCKCFRRRDVGDACHGGWFDACTTHEEEAVLCVKGETNELCDAESVEADKCTCQKIFFAVHR